MYPLKLYEGPTIHHRPCRPKVGYGLVMIMIMVEMVIIVISLILANLWHHWAHRIVNKHAFDGVEGPIVPHLRWDLQTNLQIL